MKKFKKEILIGIIFVSLYFIIGIFTLDDYGFTWDDPQEFSYAEANFKYIISKDKAVLSKIAYYTYSPSNVGNLIGFFSKKIFYDWIKIMSLDSAYHLAGIIFGSLTLLFIFFFCLKEFGLKTAIISSLSFALFPRIFGHIHNNVKDVTVMFAFTFTLISFYYLYKTKEKKWFYISAFSLGFAFNTKLLTIFLIPIIISWFILVHYLNSEFNDKNKLRKYDFVKATLIFLITLYILNPAYWIHPSFFFKTLFMMNSFTNSPFASANDYYPVLIFGNILTQANVPFYYIPLMFGIVTPISILILFLIGFHKTVKELKKPLHLLLFIWILVPIIIYAIINISIYNIIRHVLFLVPPLCILAGVGGAYLIKSLNKFIPKKKRLEKIFQTMIFIIIFSLPLIDTITYHPYQTTYFNRLIGGIKGAEENFELEYWGNSYKEGSKWLNENAEENATIIVPIAEWLPRYYLRKDISIKKEINTYEKNLYVMFMIDNTYKNNLMNTLESSKKSIHSIIIKRVPILQIYKLSKIEK